MSKKGRKKDVTRAIIKSLISYVLTIAIFLAAGVVVLSYFDDNDLLSLLGYFLVFVGVLMVLLSPILIPKDIIRIKRAHCSNCGCKFNYNEDIEWEEGGREETNNKVISIVDFNCECSICGETKSFSKKFTIATVNVDTTGRRKVKNYNLAKLVKDYLK